MLALVAGCSGAHPGAKQAADPVHPSAAGCPDMVVRDAQITQKHRSVQLLAHLQFSANASKAGLMTIELLDSASHAVLRTNARADDTGLVDIDLSTLVAQDAALRERIQTANRISVRQTQPTHCQAPTVAHLRRN